MNTEKKYKNIANWKSNRNFDLVLVAFFAVQYCSFLKNRGILSFQKVDNALESIDVFCLDLSRDYVSLNM